MDNTTSRTDKVIASYIRELMGSKGVTQAKISEALAGRSKGYVSDRILGKRSWAISELDRIAQLFGLPDALSLVAAASGECCQNVAKRRDRHRMIVGISTFFGWGVWGFNSPQLH